MIGYLVLCAFAVYGVRRVIRYQLDRKDWRLVLLLAGQRLLTRVSRRGRHR